VKLVGIIGSTGLTGNYQRIANHQAKLANWLRIGALAFMGSAVVIVIIVVFGIGKAEFSWQMALFRCLMALTCGLPGVYCAIESNRHRNVEQRNRRIELELASLNPFLANLKDEEQEKIVARLSDHYFGREPAPEKEEVLSKLKNLKAEDFFKMVEWITRLTKPT
jgi:hypothetical protein